MDINVKMQRKDADIETDICRIEEVIELTESEFDHFRHNPLNDYDFILESSDLMHVDDNGVYHCLLVLCENQNDGILVESEGSFYARYSAFVPGARQLLQQAKYDKVLTEFCDEMQTVVDKMIGDSQKYNCNRKFCIRPEKYVENYDSDMYMPIIYRMLLNRPEIEGVEETTNSFTVTMSPDYVLPQEELRVISTEEFEIMCAKHLLWIYNESGEQADFSGCDLSGLNLAHRNLNSALFVGARLNDLSLEGAELCFSDFTDAKICNCNCRNVTADEIIFKNAVAYNCDFGGACLVHGNFTGSDIKTSNFANAFLHNSCFDGADLPKYLDIRLKEVKCSFNEQEWEEGAAPVPSL